MAGRGRRRRWTACVLLLAATLTGCGGVVTLELPSAADLELIPRSPAVQSVVHDADGGTLAVLRREYREPVSLLAVPRHLVDAVLTAEDRRFYDHRGVDVRAVARAALANHTSGRAQQGGSTITQQLVKNLYLPEAERTSATKLREAVLARELERERTKADILEDYLNTVYFGEGAHGVQAAAWTYFRAEVSDLDLAQSALLAAVIRAPETLAPTRAAEAVRPRRDDVLRRMADAGLIGTDERDEAIAAPIEVHTRPPAPETREPHFVDLVVRTLLADPRFGATEAERATRLYEGGLQVHTTLRPQLQDLARATLAAHLPDPDDPEAAIAVVDPATGHVLAATGNRAYDELQFDLATQARRQPGSTFKTFVLAGAVADGHPPATVLDGRQGVVEAAGGERWEVRNYDRRNHRDITLAEATRTSVNAAFARLGHEVGIGRVAGLARAMGVRSPVPDDEPQIAIGGGELAVTPLDLAAAYGTLANLGTHVPTTPVTRIEDAEGTTVWLPDTTGRPALPPSAAHVTTEVLREVVEAGTALAAQVPGWEVAGKTGTTSDHADAWFAGYTPVLSTTVWVGHAEGRVPLVDVAGVDRVTGGTLPARIFADFTTAALAEVEPVPFTLPDEEYELVDLDPATGLLAAAWCPGRTERLPRVLVPRETCPEPPPPSEPDPPTEPDPPPASVARREPAPTTPPPATPPAPSPVPPTPVPPTPVPPTPVPPTPIPAAPEEAATRSGRPSTTAPTEPTSAEPDGRETEDTGETARTDPGAAG
jgi:membrane peptidoglycan carboxypeptidase